jgi:hypothetical protein
VIQPQEWPKKGENHISFLVESIVSKRKCWSARATRQPYAAVRGVLRFWSSSEDGKLGCGYVENLLILKQPQRRQKYTHFLQRSLVVLYHKSVIRYGKFGTVWFFASTIVPNFVNMLSI